LYYGAGSAAAGAGANVLGSGTASGIAGTQAAAGLGGAAAGIPVTTAAAAPTFGAMATGSAANVAASNAAMGLGGAAAGMAAPSAMATPAAFGTLAGANSASGMLATQQAAGLAGTANPFKVNFRDAMMANQMLGSGQQPQGGQQTSVGLRQGQAPNVSDPILALLAPKRKKKEPISLL